MILLLLLFGMWLVVMFIGSLKGPHFPNSRAFRDTYIPANIYNRMIGQGPGYKHGQELVQFTLQDFLDKKPGKTVYWDAHIYDYVEKKEDLS